MLTGFGIVLDFFDYDSHLDSFSSIARVTVVVPWKLPYSDARCRQVCESEGVLRELCAKFNRISVAYINFWSSP